MARDTAWAMAQENVKGLREMYSKRSLAEVAESLHPDAEMHQAPEVPDADDYYGREAFVRGTRRWLEGWEEFQYALEEVTDLGERVFMRVRLSGRAKASGIELDQDVFHLWTFRDGMPWRCDVFIDEGRAFKAAGLRG
jgi:ketosteroid isomerase-like protein